MRPLILMLPLFALAVACDEVETTGGTAMNTSGGLATGTIRQRDDGKYAFVLTTAGSVCSAVYDEPVANGTELAPLVCSGDGSGNATVSYGSDAAPVRATFGGLGIGSGTITF